MATARGYLATDYDLAVEVIRCRRLIKGYSDTHARGQSKFDRVLDATISIDSQKIFKPAPDAYGLIETRLGVPPAEVLPLALRYAATLAERSPLAVELSKRALNHWFRSAMPIFEASLGYEMVTAFDPDQAAHMPQTS